MSFEDKLKQYEELVKEVKEMTLDAFEKADEIREATGVNGYPLDKEKFEKLVSISILPRQYIELICSEKGMFYGENFYNGLLESKIIYDKDLIISGFFNPNLSYERNFNNYLKIWEKTKPKIDEFIDKRKKKQEADGIITVHIKL